MSSYPAIINTISINKEQKEKANSRLFEILFDWHPRPNTKNWSIKKESVSSLNSVLKEINNLTKNLKDK